MKKKLILIIVLLLNTATVNAGTSDDVLNKYGILSERVDVEDVKLKLMESFKNYNYLSEKYYKSTYLQNAEKLISVNRKVKLSEINLDNCILELKRLEDCLNAMVKVDASFEEIASIEKQYKEKQKELNELSKLKVAYCTDIPEYSINTEKVSYNTLNKALKETNTLKGEIKNAVIKEDIGEVNKLKSPTEGFFNITSEFGSRTNPITGNSIENHSGLDLAAPKNTNVLSLLKGKVIAADYNDSLGNYVIIAHSKELQTLYAHMDSLNVKKNDEVKQYQIIGYVGTTGSSTGYHLHLCVYINGVKMNPKVLFE